VGDRQRRAFERWFDRQGLPSFTVGVRPLTAARLLPPLVLISTWELLSTALEALQQGRSQAEQPLRLLQLLVLVALLVLPLLAARWVARRIDSTTSRELPVVAAVVATAVAVALAPYLNSLMGNDFVSDVAGNVAATAVLVILNYLGVGSLLAWSVREGLRQTTALREMTGRALPLFVLLSVFGFLAAEVWQVVSALDGARFWAIAAVLTCAVAGFSATISFSEMREILASDYPREAVAALAHEADRPPGVLPNADAHPPRRPVSRRERVNIVAKLALAQAFQAVLFSLVVFVFFVVFGIAAIGADIVEAWTGHVPQVAHVLGIEVFASWELVRTAAFVAMLSMVYFAASTSTDPKYRTAFYDPLSRSISLSLLVRDNYLARVSPFGTQRRRRGRRGRPTAAAATADERSGQGVSQH
jgi:hypothetical protein